MADLFEPTIVIRQSGLIPDSVSVVVRLEDGHVIKREGNTLVSTQSIPRGTAFPTSPVGGDMFIKTDEDNEIYIYDAVRSKWLGEKWTLRAGHASTHANTYLKMIDAVSMAATVGWVMPYNVTVVAAGYMNTVLVTGTIEIRANGSSVGDAISIASAKQATAVDLDLEVSSGDLLGLYFNADIGTPSDGQAWVHLRRHP